MSFFRLWHAALFSLLALNIGCGQMSPTSPANQSTAIVENNQLASTEKILFTLEQTPPETADYEYNMRFENLVDIATTKSRCPEKTSAEELKQFISSNSLCFIENSSPANSLCTLSITFPYATLVTPSREIQLGYKNSGCASTTDFCNQKREEFVQLLNELVSSAKEENCL